MKTIIFSLTAFKAVRAFIFLSASVPLWLLSSSPLHAASCCGGGSSASLTLPKFATFMFSTGFDHEIYNGYWNTEGDYREDPEGSDLRQLRMNIGAAYRLHDNIQTFLSIPYVYNINKYSGLSSESYGAGDITAGFNFELFNDIRCVYRVLSLEDIWPATYLGVKAIVPTGLSPYDDVPNSFDITGLGFYTFNFNLLIDKTINSFNMTLGANYSISAKRTVNMEYGRFIEPYDIQQGDKLNLSASAGYSFLLKSMDSITLTLGYAYLEEFKWKINDAEVPFTGFNKHNLTVGLAFATSDMNDVIKLGNSFNIPEDNWGSNKPATITTTLEYSHVIR
jgi:hypothetical protein